MKVPEILKNLVLGKTNISGLLEIAYIRLICNHYVCKTKIY